MAGAGPNARPLGRRDFLRAAAIGAAAVAIDGRWSLAKPHHHKHKHRHKVRLWSDRKTWPGRKVPGPGSVAMVHGRVLLDKNASVAGVHIMPGAELIFPRRRTRTLISTGNVMVMGTLTMRPRADKRHRIIFQRVKESAFIGEVHDPVPSDVGLWVMHGGDLNIRGPRKLAWTRAAGGVAAGTLKIRLQEDPYGWRVGDFLALTPTISPSQQGHHVAYDYATVKAIQGRDIELSKPTVYDHPAVEVKPGSTYGAEVLNLSRAVEIEGTAEGRSHVFVHSSRPQRVEYAAIRYMGPQQPDDEGYMKLVTGRYGLHFHMCDEGSRGSVVDGVVVRDCGAHAFVPHLSHGITFRQCISHNTHDDAYWWDQPEGQHPGKMTSFSHDTMFERCVASLVLSDPVTRGYRISGFSLGALDGNAAVGCVAVGVQGTRDSSGFKWPEFGHGAWRFEDCVGHNNAYNGIFTWQNPLGPSHLISRFVAYHNGSYGIRHGAYVNRFVYEDSVLYGNLEGGLLLFAVAPGTPGPGLAFRNITFDGAGISEHGVVNSQHTTIPKARTPFTNCSFRGHRGAAFGLVYEGREQPDWLDVVNCSFDGNEFWLADGIHKNSSVRVQDPVNGTLELKRSDQLVGGTFRPEWNAVVRSIPSFA